MIAIPAMSQLMKIKWILVSQETSLFFTINSVLVALNITINREENCVASQSALLLPVVPTSKDEPESGHHCKRSAWTPGSEGQAWAVGNSGMHRAKFSWQ